MKNKYNFASRAALFVLALTASFATAFAAQTPPANTYWYNGDFDGVNGLANEQNTIVSQAGVYDNFNVTGSGVTIGGVFSDNLLNTNVTGASWEIRSGVSEMNAGTLIASGNVGVGNNLSVQLTGRNGFGFLEYQVQVTGLSVNLAPGQYFLNVTPTGDGTGRSFNSTTSGANCIGSPCAGDGNAWFNSTFFGTFFDAAGNQVGGNPDFSMGVVAVPEPATIALLTCGVGALLIAVRRRRS